jgi:methyl-branched lipid omega-hydroxylase
VAAPEISGVGDVDLGSLEFWGRPAQERDEYFEMLRREAPISRHEPPEDILGLGDRRLHYFTRRA